MYCKSCGKVIPDGKTYCNMCAEELPSVGFMEAAKLFFANYSNFKGRARRSEYWWASVFTGIVSGILSYVLPALGGVWGLIILVPSISITVRRLHDIGKSGWCYLVGCIPVVGQIIMLVWSCTDSKEDNQWGPNPKIRLNHRPAAKVQAAEPSFIPELPKAETPSLPAAEENAFPLTAVPTMGNRMPDAPAIPLGPVETPAAFSITMILCTGPSAGRQFTFRAGQQVTFGRACPGEHNSVLVAYDKVSGTHCSIGVNNGSVNVTDLGSTNGTIVNGQRLTPNMPVTVSHGGVIFLADNNCAFQVKFN